MSSLLKRLRQKYPQYDDLSERELARLLIQKYPEYTKDVTTPRVFIITYCRSRESLYGTVLVFKTLRVGFPHADVTVIDNASLTDVRSDIRRAAERCDVTFVQARDELPHGNAIEAILLRGDHDGRPLVFVDPDIVFWEQCEQWDFGEALLAGRLMPGFVDPLTGSWTMPRIHTSFAWFPDVDALRAEWEVIRKQYFDFMPVLPVMMPTDRGWVRWDTLSGLSIALGKKAKGFTEDQLGAYDHLFCGTHLDRVASCLPTDLRKKWTAVHEAVKHDDIQAARGMWKMQQRAFEELAANG